MSSDDPTPPDGPPRERVVLDPVLAELRRRHPDVDVVVLPPGDAGGPGAGADPGTPALEPRPADRETALRVAHHVDTVLEAVLAGLVARGVYDGTEAPTGRGRGWTGRGDDPDGATYTASVGFAAADPDAARHVLEQVGDLLLANGHDARAVVGRRVRLLSSDGRSVVDAEATGSHVRVEVRSLPLLLGRDDLVAVRQRTREGTQEGTQEGRSS